VIEKPDVDWLALAPVFSLLGASAVALLGAVIVPKWLRALLAAASVAAGFVVAFVFAVVLFVEDEQATTVIGDAFARDRYAWLAAMIVCGAGFLTVGLSWAEPVDMAYRGEFYALLAAVAAGMVFFVSAANLMVLF
jgi:NADH:ubiquinone oxidoreductase subunit 2 (subunit N)